jgi:predicted dehydrogenase
VRTLRLGIIGCGEAGQILHLPSLRQLGEPFDVRAVCDASRSVADGVAASFGVPLAVTDPGELLALADVDAVLVASPDHTHASMVLAALAAGKHVLVEKPMCVTLREADEIVAAQARTGLVVQVGYMRRHAAAFAEARALIADLGEIRLARVHQLLGANPLIIEPTSRVLRPGDEPLPASPTSMDALVREAIGDVGDDLATAYRLLLSVSSHDLSVMRDLLGMPEGVLHATARHAGGYLTATFDYGPYVCQFETGIDDIPRFDCHIEVYAGDKVVRLEYDTPYVRNLPTRVVVLEANGRGGVSETTMHTSWGDAFVSEWRAFHASVTEGVPARTSAADFRNDLELFGAMVRAMA